MNTKLYVSNFATITTEKELPNLFSVHGNVSQVNLPPERASGRPQGFAIVTMATPQGAQAAMLALHGEEVEDRVLAVFLGRSVIDSVCIRPCPRIVNFHSLKCAGEICGHRFLTFFSLVI